MSADILAALAVPFDPTVISWRIGSVSKGDGTKPPRGMALAYLDSRDVQDRLNAVMGMDWQVRHPWSCGTKLACEIGLKIDGEWIWRGDGAGDSDVEAEKGAFSDSFKRAAVRWGIGRYLYDVQSPWVTVEPAGKSWRIPEAELRRLASVLPRPANARARNQSAARSTAEADPFVELSQEPPSPHPRSDEARAAYAKIKSEVKAARLPRVIDDIVKVHSDNINLIREVSPDGYEDLMNFATARKGELLAAA